MVNISVIGLGKLGSPMAACFADGGYYVIGVDSDASKVCALNAGQAPVDEPGLQSLITHHRRMLQAHFVSDTAQVVQHTEATFLIVPTPTGADGAFSLEAVLPACRAIGQGIAAIDRYHLVVITSTVMPGHTRAAIIPALEAASGKTCGVDFGVCYSPEFIALGQVVRGLQQPDMVLIGQGDERAGEMLESIYRNVVKNAAPIRRMSIESAELCKLAVNGFTTMKISYANMLGMMCNYLPGANVDDVTGAMGLDTRIGPKQLKAATPYGGPCFPRDNRALSIAAALLGITPHLPRATDATNADVVEYIVSEVMRHTRVGMKVAVIGAAYKPDTAVTEESAGRKVVDRLFACDRTALVYDPAIPGVYDSAQDCVNHARAVVLMLPLEECQTLQFRIDQIVIDPWRVVNEAATDAVVVQPGVGLDCNTTVGTADPVANGTFPLAGDSNAP